MPIARFDREDRPDPQAPQQGPTGVGNAQITGPTGDWVNLGAYFSLNQPQAQQMAQGMAQNLEQGARGAMVGAPGSNPESAAHAMSDLAASTTQPGLQALYSENKSGAYTGGMSGLDAYLSGRAGGDRFADLKARFTPALGAVGTAPAVLNNPIAPPPYLGTRQTGKYDWRPVFDPRARRA